MDLAADLEAYVTADRRDSNQEQTLLHRIRALPRPERMEVIAPLLKTQWLAAFSLAHRAQLARGDYIVIFKQGLEDGDASSVKLWMEATVPHIGWRAVISMLRERAAPWPSKGAFALYHMPFLFHDYPLPPSLRKEFVQLLELYEREKPLPFLPDNWRNISRSKNKRPFVFVWDGRQIRSTESDEQE